MKFDNQTPFPAVLDMGSTTDHEQVGLLSCRVTFGWDAAGKLSPLPAAQMWPVTRAPEDFEGTLLLPDSDYRREGIDILVFGDAVAPQDKRAREMRIGVATGRFMRQYDVLGDRQWVRARADAPWQSSVPEPFEQMPTSTPHAFGGKAGRSGERQMHVMNPQGKGFVCDEGDVASVQLPNLERPEQRLKHWQDQPVPACLQKPAGGLLLDATGPDSWDGIGSDGKQLTRVMMKHSFQQAPPDFVCPRGGLGSVLHLKGFDASGMLSLALPPEVASTERGAMAYVEIGQLKAVLPLRIASLIVLVPDCVLVVGFTAAFRYWMQAGDQRRTQLRWHGSPHFELER